MTNHTLEKMATEYHAGEPVVYTLKSGPTAIPVSEHLGKKIQLNYTGKIHCIECGRKTNKSFQQGLCFPCMRALPQADMCMVKPETCHLAQGTCRDPSWGEAHCQKQHTIYLANSSGIKVGITRQEPIKRWIDQGASQAIKAWTVSTRLESGIVESSLKEHVSDRTDWRKMLKGNPEPMDLVALAEELSLHLPDGIEVKEESPEIWEIKYPVLKFPDKIKSLNFDKTPNIDGTLLGIKGQYLILEEGVLNIKKFQGYEVEISV